MNAFSHPGAEPALPLIAATPVCHIAGNLEAALRDVVTVLRACERQLVTATDDTGMKRTTEDLLVEVARTVSVVGRLVEYEAGECGQLLRMAEDAIGREAV